MITILASFILRLEKEYEVLKSRISDNSTCGTNRSANNSLSGDGEVRLRFNTPSTSSSSSISASTASPNLDLAKTGPSDASKDHPADTSKTLDKILLDQS